MVAAFATAWWERGEAVIHETAGKIAIGLIIFRAVWGLVGPGSARFDTFVHGPKGTLNYVLSIFKGNPVHHIGHNPAGAAMIGLMLLTLVATTASGVLMTTTALWGNGWIEWIHGTSANLMLVLIGGHLLGILVAALQHRENLIWSMITGWKWVPANTEPYLGNLKITVRSLFGAAIVLALGVGLWNGATTLLNASAWRMQRTISAELKKAGCDHAMVTGPRIEVYPSLQFRYEVQVDPNRPLVFKALSADEALQRRPALVFDELTEACGLPVKPVEQKQGSVEVSPVAGTPLLANIVLSNPSPAIGPIEEVAASARVQATQVRSATELAAMFSFPEIVLTAVSSQHLPQTKAVFFGTVVTDPTRIHSSAPNFIDETDLVTTAVTESALIDLTESDTDKRHPALKPVDIKVKVKAPPQQKREAVKSSKSKASFLKKKPKLLKVKRIGHVRSIYVYQPS